jgi:hypothetical protein
LASDLKIYLVIDLVIYLVACSPVVRWLGGEHRATRAKGRTCYRIRPFELSLQRKA